MKSFFNNINKDKILVIGLIISLNNKITSNKLNMKK